MAKQAPLHIIYIYIYQHIDGLIQERRNAIAKALVLRFSYTSLSIESVNATSMW